MTKGSTRALDTLLAAGASFEVHAYATTVDVVGATYGEAVAAELGFPPQRVFKTLIAVVDDAPVVAIVPVATRLSEKLLAAAVGGKRSALAEPSEAERLTGYVTGGISPFGQRREMPAVVDSSAFEHPTILVNGGRRGIQVEVSPRTLIDLIGAATADLAA